MKIDSASDNYLAKSFSIQNYPQFLENLSILEAKYLIDL
jgi:hypothetical protein